MPSKSVLSIPDNLVGLLAAAEAKHGLPTGTMHSVMQQEVGGNFNKFLNDPGAYHYGLNESGQRIAPHSGKVSTAFGPFGITESTAADPGFGVKPLADKSLPEQVRFASDYLAARSKAGGGLQAGLAGYGEGAKYAQQVVSRVGGGQSPPEGVAPAAASALPMVAQAAPVAVADSSPAPVAPPVQTQVVVPATPQAGPPPMAQADAWQEFLKKMPQAKEPVNVADLSYGGQVPESNVAPQFRYQPTAAQVPNFSAFGTWGPQRGRVA